MFEEHVDAFEARPAGWGEGSWTWMGAADELGAAREAAEMLFLRWGPGTDYAFEVDVRRYHEHGAWRRYRVTMRWDLEAEEWSFEASKVQVVVTEEVAHG